MRLRHLLGFGFCVALSFVAAFGQAVPFSFTGSVTQINSDPADPFSGSVHLGTSFSGSFVFDSTAADALPADPLTGSFTSSGTSYRTILTIGGRTFTVNDSLHIGVANNYSGPVDQYAVAARNSDGSLVLELLLEDPSGTAFAEDILPLAPPGLTGFATAGFTFTAQNIDGNYVEILGHIDSLTFLQPAISSISPGIARPNSQVTITGSGFVGNVQVFFNGVEGVVQVVDENTLIVTIPLLPPGPVEVTVTTPGGNGTAPPGSLQVGDIPIPTLSEWGMILLFSALLAMGIMRLRNNRHKWLN